MPSPFCPAPTMPYGLTIPEDFAKGKADPVHARVVDQFAQQHPRFADQVESPPPEHAEYDWEADCKQIGLSHQGGDGTNLFVSSFGALQAQAERQARQLFVNKWFDEEAETGPTAAMIGEKVLEVLTEKDPLKEGMLPTGRDHACDSSPEVVDPPCPTPPSQPEEEDDIAAEPPDDPAPAPLPPEGSDQDDPKDDPDQEEDGEQTAEEAATVTSGTGDLRMEAKEAEEATSSTSLGALPTADEEGEDSEHLAESARCSDIQALLAMVEHIQTSMTRQELRDMAIGGGELPEDLMLKFVTTASHIQHPCSESMWSAAKEIMLAKVGSDLRKEQSLPDPPATAKRVAFAVDDIHAPTLGFPIHDPHLQQHLGNGGKRSKQKHTKRSKK